MYLRSQLHDARELLPPAASSGTHACLRCLSRQSCSQRCNFEMPRLCALILLARLCCDLSSDGAQVPQAAGGGLSQDAAAPRFGRLHHCRNGMLPVQTLLLPLAGLDLDSKPIALARVLVMCAVPVRSRIHCCRFRVRVLAWSVVQSFCCCSCVLAALDSCVCEQGPETTFQSVLPDDVAPAGVRSVLSCSPAACKVCLEACCSVVRLLAWLLSTTQPCCLLLFLSMQHGCVLLGQSLL